MLKMKYWIVYSVFNNHLPNKCEIAELAYWVADRHTPAPTHTHITMWMNDFVLLPAYSRAKVSHSSSACIARNNENAKGEQRKSCELKVARMCRLVQTSLQSGHKVHGSSSRHCLHFPIDAKVLSDNDVQFYSTRKSMANDWASQRKRKFIHDRVMYRLDVVVCRHRSTYALRIQ